MRINTFSRIHRENERSNVRYVCTSCNCIIKTINNKSRPKKHYCKESPTPNGGINHDIGDFSLKPPKVKNVNTNKKIDNKK